MGCLHIKQSPQKTFLLVVLLEELLRESALLSSQVQQLPIIELRLEILCQHPAYLLTSCTYLSANINNYMFHLSIIGSRF